MPCFFCLFIRFFSYATLYSHPQAWTTLLTATDWSLGVAMAHALLFDGVMPVIDATTRGDLDILPYFRYLRLIDGLRLHQICVVVEHLLL